VISTTSSLRTLAIITCLLLPAAVGGGCSGESPTTPSAPFAQTDLRAGSGAAAAAGNRISVFYTGWIYDADRPDQKGLQFETNVGAESPLTFTLGIGQVIQGWDQGIVNQRVGGLRQLVIPPALGYGGFRNGPIPPNATLIFEVELVGLEAQ
jgi:FKBP-type peptidyl-prolyl cis-trans isomerase FkpA